MNLLLLITLIWSPFAAEYRGPDYVVCIYSSTDAALPLRQWPLFAKVPAAQTNFTWRFKPDRRLFAATLRNERTGDESDPSPRRP